MLYHFCHNNPKNKLHQLQSAQLFCEPKFANVTTMSCGRGSGHKEAQLYAAQHTAHKLLINLLYLSKDTES